MNSTTRDDVSGTESSVRRHAVVRCRLLVTYSQVPYAYYDITSSPLEFMFVITIYPRKTKESRFILIVVCENVILLIIFIMSIINYDDEDHDSKTYIQNI